MADEEERESPTTSDESQAVEPPPQSSRRDPAPWILASRNLRMHQKPLDAEFMLHMAGIRRQFDGASLKSTNSTLQILGSYVSLDSLCFPIHAPFYLCLWRMNFLQRLFSEMKSPKDS